MAHRTWVDTWTGKKVDLLNPDPDQIEIEDIAHHLAILPRFTGATKHPYSIAQHSMYVSMMVPEYLQLHALLHDAHEAYINDINTPLKEAINTYSPNFDDPLRVIADGLDEAIRTKFDLEPLDSFGIFEIKRADMQAMADEKLWLKPNSQYDWAEYGLPPPAGRIEATLTWREAKEAFLERFWRIYERTSKVQSHS